MEEPRDMRDEEQGIRPDSEEAYLMRILSRDYERHLDEVRLSLIRDERKNGVCVPPSRFWTVLLKRVGEFSQEELIHIEKCRRCALWVRGFEKRESPSWGRRIWDSIRKRFGRVDT